MSSVGDSCDLTVDDSVGPGSIDAIIEDQDRLITDRSRGGPRMKMPTEAKRGNITGGERRARGGAPWRE